MVFEQFRKIERRGHTYRLRVHEFIICAFIDAFEKRRGVVDENIDMPAFLQNICRKAFKRILFRDVADKPWPRLDVDHMDDGAFAFKAFRAAFSDSVTSASDDDDFIFE